MAGPFSDIERSIFVSKEVLSEDHQPDQILERDEEIDQYRHALQDVLFGRTPQNVMLYGKAGLGKTAVTKYMMEALQDEVTKRPDADELYVHELNCNGKSLHRRSHPGQRALAEARERVSEAGPWNGRRVRRTLFPTRPNRRNASRRL